MINKTKYKVALEIIGKTEIRTEMDKGRALNTQDTQPSSISLSQSKGYMTQSNTFNQIVILITNNKRKDPTVDLLNPSNAEAIFVQSTRTQRFLKII